MKPSDEVRFTVKECREMAAECSTFKNLLEKIRPEVLEIEFKEGLIYLEGPFRSVPYVLIKTERGFFPFGLSNAFHGAVDQPFLERAIKKHLMHSGTITITVKDGKVAGATVKED